MRAPALDDKPAFDQLNSRTDMERDYLYERAEAELKLAQQATDPKAVKAHYELAGYYLDRYYGGGDERSGAGETAPEPPPSDRIRDMADDLAHRLKSLGIIVFRP